MDAEFPQHFRISDKETNMRERVKLTLDIPVDNAVFMEDVDGCSDLFTIEPDDVFLQPQSGHLLQSALVTVLHEDVHLLLQGESINMNKLLRDAPCDAWLEAKRVNLTRWSSTPKYRTKFGCLMPSNILSSSAVSLMVL